MKFDIRKNGSPMESGKHSQDEIFQAIEKHFPEDPMVGILEIDAETPEEAVALTGIDMNYDWYPTPAGGWEMEHDGNKYSIVPETIW